MEDIIVIQSGRFSMDWVDYDINKIDVNKIIGFELSWRGDDWHVRVVTKQKVGEYDFYEYELGHWVNPGEVKKLYENPKAKIIRITNTHNSNNFKEQLKTLTQ